MRQQRTSAIRHEIDAARSPQEKFATGRAEPPTPHGGAAFEVLMRFGLVPSPFVGPSIWREFAGLLKQARVIDYGGVEGPDWYDGPAQRIVDQMDDDPWIAVLHSSAGPFAPSLAASAKELRGLVFVDAVLPHPGSSASEIAPPGQIEQLRDIASPTGLLPKWNTWFPPTVIDSWLPDQEARAAVLADIPRVPLAFLEARAPSHHEEWEDLPATFIKLSEGYERNAARAEERGWLVKRIEASHLGMVSHADKLVAALAGCGS